MLLGVQAEEYSGVEWSVVKTMAMEWEELVLDMEDMESEEEWLEWSILGIIGAIRPDMVCSLWRQSHKTEDCGAFISRPSASGATATRKSVLPLRHCAETDNEFQTAGLCLYLS